MMPLTFFIGSYTEFIVPGFGGTGDGIYTVQMDMETGKLTVLHTEGARNPSYLALSMDNRFLYCSTEVGKHDDPRVKAYAIKDDFSLEYRNEQPIPGGFPCHITCHRNAVMVACYQTGNILQYPLESTGKVKPFQNNHVHSGSSINTERQEEPHAHQAKVHPNHTDIYVCDLGLDMIKVYRFLDNSLEPYPNKDCRVTPGGGPRHMVFNRDASLAYVMNELTSAISVLEEQDGVFHEIGTYASLPMEYEEKPSGSAIQIHPNGRYLYAANRTLDALTIFAIQDKQLETIDYQYTQGKEIREFNITPDGHWLIACHQNSHDTIVYKIQTDGKLTEMYRTQEILSPVCVVFQNRS
ncbi:MAG: lactonase family protein [Bacteroidota bacterium]